MGEGIGSYELALSRSTEDDCKGCWVRAEEEEAFDGSGVEVVVEVEDCGAFGHH